MKSGKKEEKKWKEPAGEAQSLKADPALQLKYRNNSPECKKPSAATRAAGWGLAGLCPVPGCPHTWGSMAMSDSGQGWLLGHSWCWRSGIKQTRKKWFSSFFPMDIWDPQHHWKCHFTAVNWGLPRLTQKALRHLSSKLLARLLPPRPPRFT